MKIGIFTECYEPVMNGVVVSVETFKKSLEKRGHEVIVFAPDNDCANYFKDVYRFPSIQISKKLYPVMFPVLAVEKTYLPENVIEDLDIIHAQHMFTAGAMARYAAKKYNKPLVYTYHTLITEYANKYSSIFAPIVGGYLKRMSRNFCNSVDQVIAPSSSLKRILRKFGVKTPIDVVMTGINPEDYGRSDSTIFRKKNNISENDKILLFVGRLAPEKNLSFLLRSFKSILNDCPDTHLVLVGGGPDEDRFREEIESLEIRKKVTMTGMLPKPETNKIFGMADIFAFPSYTETQGIVIAEAMACGTVPVAVGKMGPVDLIHDGEDGYLTKLKIKDFSQKIVMLLKDDKLRMKMAESGKKRINEFSSEHSADLLEKIYKDTILRHKSL